VLPALAPPRLPFYSECSMSLIAADRFGFNAARTRSLEATLEWAGASGFFHADFNADAAPNGLTDFDAARVKRVRELCERHNIKIGIHTSSATNNAEIAPLVGEAVDEYLRANVQLAKRLGCDWVIVHGGYHFGDVELRRKAAVTRLQRLADYASAEQMPLWFENHNTEPAHAEIHYIPDNVEELRWFLDAPGLFTRSGGTGGENPYFRWSFNAAHAHLVPDEITGFLAAFGVARMAQVRLTDNTGDYEVHLVPGLGDIDFPDLFKRLDAAGYRGPFSLDFGGDADKVRIRDEWLAL
jgi:sugar phosphate isomerase/epimerase